jgi:hypothetical protein
MENGVTKVQHGGTENPDPEVREDRRPSLSPVDDRSSVMGSSGDSLEFDLLSISSEDSDCFRTVDSEGYVASIISQVSHRIFVEFKWSRGCNSRPQCAPGRNSGGGSNSSNAPNSSHRSQHQPASQTNGSEVRLSGKRSLPQRDDGDEDRDDDGFRGPPRPIKRPKQSPSRPPARILACPFWKLDSQTHRRCFHIRPIRIADVKLHLNRKHKQPEEEYCQRCWIAFKNKTHKDVHLSDESSQRCKYNPAARPVGIDNTMAIALHKKSNPKYSTEDQWFAIWDIVCPDHPRPLSPYINDSLTEDATQLIELIVNQWPSILANEIGDPGALAASNDLDRLGMEHLIRTTLARLSADFSAEQAQTRVDGSVSSHESPGAQTSDSSNRADSGIEVRSYYQSGQLSASSSAEGLQSISGVAVAAQLETHLPARLESSVRHDDSLERFILPSGQNNIDASFDQRQIPIGPPMTSRVALTPDLTIMQTTDFYGGGRPLDPDYTLIDDRFTALSGYPASQNVFGDGEFDAPVSSEGLEVLPEADWSTFESPSNQGEYHGLS